MSVVTKVFNLYSYKRLKVLDETRMDPWRFQREWFDKILKSGSNTSFGKEHNFGSLSDISGFQKVAPLLDYDKIEPYIDRVRSGEDYVLWDSKIKWFAKSSGTSSSKSKFIPITNESISSCHYDGMQNMLATYMSQNPESRLFDGMALTLGGSAKEDEAGKGGTQCGDL
ncbi:MAG TPA: GH3 auxin-responsive promoter family protein, partial [Bacteroidales bacterium]|nr:GH3 auxin-responsive promoter family protein [Bacteroidales bacterium]